MSRLIDADKLTRFLDDWWYKVAPSTHEPQEVQEVLNITVDAIEGCIIAVNTQPTAYDINEKVEQLEELIEKNVGFMRATPEANTYIKAIRDAIEIVKGGAK